MAITMWDHLIPGLEKLRRDRVPVMDLTYFTFHRELESTHEEAMAKAVRAIDAAPGLVSGGLSPAESDAFRNGMLTVLDYLEGFWKGLDHAEAQTSEDVVHTESAARQ
jgi:hypothetical protein